jgi:hypothetical protein
MPSAAKTLANGDDHHSSTQLSKIGNVRSRFRFSKELIVASSRKENTDVQDGAELGTLFTKSWVNTWFRKVN